MTYGTTHDAGLIHETDVDVTEQATVLLHCGKCLDEWKASGQGLSPREYARQQVGLTPRGLQIWCTRHDCNIDLITLASAED